MPPAATTVRGRFVPAILQYLGSCGHSFLRPVTTRRRGVKRQPTADALMARVFGFLPVNIRQPDATSRADQQLMLARPIRPLDCAHRVRPDISHRDKTS